MKFKKTGNDYLEFEDITVPAYWKQNGISSEFTLKKQPGSYSVPETIKQFFKK